MRHPNLLLIGLLLALADPGYSACITDPMMQGQDPQAEFKDGYYNLVQSDGCNIRLRRATTLRKRMPRRGRFRLHRAQKPLPMKTTVDYGPIG